MFGGLWVAFFPGKLSRCFQISRCSPWYNPNNSVSLSHFIKIFGIMETVLGLRWKFCKENHGQEFCPAQCTLEVCRGDTAQRWIPKMYPGRETSSKPTMRELPGHCAPGDYTQLCEGTFHLTVPSFFGHAGNHQPFPKHAMHLKPLRLVLSAGV